MLRGSDAEEALSHQFRRHAQLTPVSLACTWFLAYVVIGFSVGKSYSFL